MIHNIYFVIYKYIHIYSKYFKIYDSITSYINYKQLNTLIYRKFNGS